MKTLSSLILILVPFIGTSQLIGFEDYQPVYRSNSISEKQYIITTSDYEYQISDREDSKISLDKFDLVWDEMNRILSENSASISTSEVLDGGIESTDYESVKCKVKSGRQVIIKHKISEDLYIYLVFSDTMCGMSVTRTES